MTSLCVTPGPGAALGAACQSHSACASGYCHLGLCTESCKSYCPDGLLCQESYEPIPETPTGETLVPVPVCLPGSGVVVWDPAGWAAEYKNQAPIPSLAVSFTLQLTSEVATDWPLLRSLSGATATLYDINNESDSPLRVTPEVAVMTAMVPNAPQITLDNGGWYKFSSLSATVTEGSFVPSSAPVHAKMVYKFGPGGKMDRGTLNVRFVILPMAGSSCRSLNASNAPTVLSAAVETMRTIYAQADIELGQVEYVDLNRPDLARIDGWDETAMGRLFETSTQFADGFLNFFLVQSLEMDGLLGVSGGIPGPMFPGTVHSGVVIDWCTEWYLKAAGIGRVAAHEAGHYLGLFHTIEEDGSTDLLDDTARDNFMYWADEEKTYLSPGQSFVMRNHPLVR